jgi:Zn-dependent peptidase ImmA (M78 family)
MTMHSEQPIGGQLRLARMAWGQSLDEIGASTLTSRQFVHQLETGAKIPNPEMLAVLAEVMGVQESYFHKVNSAPVTAEQCHFRKQQTTPISITSQVLARGTLLDCFVSRLDKKLRLPKVNFPDLAIRSDEEIEEVAEACRRHWNLGLIAPITNMMRVVENAGAVVTYFHGISERVDALSMDRRRPIIVRSSAKESLCRLRFDLAHEAGHLVMHRGLHTGDQHSESQANRFASAFLLPRAGFLKEFPRGARLNWPAMFQMKKRWKVAVRAIVRRALDLGLISASQYRSANIHLVKTGQAKLERYDDELPMENPELLDTALDALEQTMPNATRGIVDDLGWDDRLYKLIVGKTLPTRGLPEGTIDLLRVRLQKARDRNTNE